MIRFECKLLIASAQYVAAFFHKYNIKELANRITQRYSSVIVASTSG